MKVLLYTMLYAIKETVTAKCVKYYSVNIAIKYCRYLLIMFKAIYELLLRLLLRNSIIRTVF